MKNSLVSHVFDSFEYTFIVDSIEIRDYILNSKQKCVMYSEDMQLPGNCVNIQTSSEHFLSLKRTASLSPKSRVLTIPLVAFDSSFECFKYLFHQLQNCNLLSIYSRYKKLMKVLKDVGPKFSVTSRSEIQLLCNFSDKVSFSYPLDIEIEEGKVRSIAEYFEVNFNHLYPDLPPPFNLNGEFKFSSCLYAIHPSVNNIFGEQIKCAKKLFQDVCLSSNCSMIIENNDAKSFKVNNVERINDLVTIAGDSRNSTVTEFAFGLNRDIYNNIIWSLNSQINEGCSGIHMDFISPVKNDKTLVIKKLN